MKETHMCLLTRCECLVRGVIILLKRVLLLLKGHCYHLRRSSILNDVAASSARTRPPVTKTLLVLGEGGGMELCSSVNVLLSATLFSCLLTEL